LGIQIAKVALYTRGWTIGEHLSVIKNVLGAQTVPVSTGFEYGIEPVMIVNPSQSNKSAT